MLGWHTWRQIESERVQLLTQPLSDLMRAGMLSPQPLDLLARVVLAAAGEAGRTIADAPDPDAPRRDAEVLLTGLLSGLRTAQ